MHVALFYVERHADKGEGFHVEHIEIKRHKSYDAEFRQGTLNKIMRDVLHRFLFSAAALLALAAVAAAQVGNH